MKKICFLLSGCLILSACVAHETNLEAAQAERDATLYQKRAQEGCTFLRDQDAYRECLLATYNASKPKTYETAELINGQPIAIISSPKECGETGPSVPQVAPLPSAEPEVMSYTTTETTRIDAEYPPLPAYQPPKLGEMIVAEEVIATEVPVQEPVVQQPQPVPVQPALQKVKVASPPTPVAPVQTQKQESWWNVHQEQGMAKATKPTCPCPDPNDPCPQCYEK